VSQGRARMAIRDNIVTPEVRANGYGAIDLARLAESIDQIGLVYTFKAKPKADEMPPADERRVH
jgi:NitT/TauT family transport system substrate-binding protein